MDRLEAMAILLAAVEEGSLSKASRKLGLPLPTVSRKVADLETHLRATLLVRSSKGLELTPAGRAYVTAARTILEQVNEAERVVAGEYAEPRGDLVVSAPTMLGRLHLLPVVLAFLDAYPDVSVDLALSDRIAHFMADQVDVALRVGALADSELVATRVGTLRKVLCASPGYLASQGTPRAADDLRRHRLVSFESVSTTSTWSFGTDPDEVRVTFRARLGINSIEAALDASLAGAGIVRAMSYQAADHVRAGRLAIVLPELEPAPPPVHLVYDRQSRMPLKLRAFVDFVVPRIRSRLEAAALP